MHRAPNIDQVLQRPTLDPFYIKAVGSGVRFGLLVNSAWTPTVQINSRQSQYVVRFLGNPELKPSLRAF